MLAAATALNPLDFHWQPPPEGLLFTNMPSGFVCASAANPPPGVAPPNPLASSIPVFGVPRYRASIPYTALAPRATFGDPGGGAAYRLRAITKYTSTMRRPRTITIKQLSIIGKPQNTTKLEITRMAITCMSLNTTNRHLKSTRTNTDKEHNDPPARFYGRN